MTDQSAQSTVPPVSVETTTGNQTSASGLENNKKPRIKVIIVGGFFLILAALVIGAGIYYSQKQPPTPAETPPPSPITNLKTAGGRIIQVDPTTKTLKVESTVQGVSKTWNIVITEKTTLAKSSDWQEESKAESFAGGKTFGQIKESVKKLTLDDFKEGGVIFIIVYPEQDLASEEQIIGPNVLLLET